MKTLFFSAFSAIFLSASVFATEPYSGAGTSGFSFLKITGSAKSVAMSRTGVAGDESYGINPASFSGSEKFLSTSYCYLMLSTHTGSLSYTQPHSFGNLSGSMDYLSSPGIEKTDQQGNVLGEFSYSIIMPGLVLAKDINPNFSAGLGAKFLYSSVDEYNAAVFSFSAGGIYRFPEINGFSIGACVENIGLTIKAYDEEKDPLPLKFTGGVSFARDFYALNADFSKASDARFIFAFGGEIKPYKMIALRAGYSTKGTEYKTGDSNDLMSGMSFGAGFFLQKISLDYSFVPMKDLGYSHKIGLNFNL
ncbi:PorV/PorQ family protein [candidate division WOR-3 bacterium]|nr:PorV/PorQ family protein [candidate division WOR-3 bacterium]